MATQSKVSRDGRGRGVGCGDQGRQAGLEGSGKAGFAGGFEGNWGGGRQIWPMGGIRGG